MIKSNIPRELRTKVVRPNDSEAVVKGAVTAGILRHVSHHQRIVRFHHLLYFHQLFDEKLNPEKLCIQDGNVGGPSYTGSLVLEKGRSVTLDASFTVPMTILLKDESSLEWTDRLYLTKHDDFVYTWNGKVVDQDKQSRSC